ncbi:MAG: Lrp/AsnC family transcriptional regulator [Clostridia bacterium]|nr:Lrp/AsnC family transcriptional regulator [Clostridia bacterium]
MTTLEKDILNVLTQDARLAPKKIAAMLSVDEETVAQTIRNMENSGVLVKYTAIVNGEKADDSLVQALIEVKVSPKKKEGFDGIAKQIAAFPEVKSVYLMSGAYDLAVFVEDKTLLGVSRFVSEKISTFDGVLSTATHFILKKYKIEGTLTEPQDADNRLCVQA